MINGTASSRLTFLGPGAGSEPTASAVVSDIIDILSRHPHQPRQRLWTRSAEIYEAELSEEQREATNRELGFPLSQLQQRRFFAR